jgi:hypothetical protein
MYAVVYQHQDGFIVKILAFIFLDMLGCGSPKVKNRIETTPGIA